MATSQSTPAPLDFVQYQGDTFRRTLAFSEDVTGWLFEGHVRTDVADIAPDPVAELVFVEVTSKSVEVSLAATLTAMMAGRYVYDIQTTIDGDGTFAVGTDIAPGVYQSAGPVENGACYWKRTNGDELIDNAMTKKPQIVSIEPTDTAFTTNDCQQWQKTDAAPPPQAAPGDLLGQLGAFIGKGILAGGG